MNLKQSLAALVAVGLLVAAAIAGPAFGAEDARATLRAVDGSQVQGAVRLSEMGTATIASVSVRGLPPRSTAVARLHAGTSLDRLSASSTRLERLRADGRGNATASGRVLFQGREDVALADIADGEHVVVVESRGRIVAYAIVPPPGS